MGFFNKIELDALSFCKPCAESKWPAKRNSEIISAMCEESPPCEFFRVEKVNTKDPNYENTTLIGTLIFTDKGVCFAQSDKYISDRTLLTKGLFGPIIGGIANSVLDEVDIKKISSQSIVQNDDIYQIMGNSPYLILCKPSDIANIYISNNLIRVSYVHNGLYKEFSFSVPEKVNDYIQIKILNYLKWLALSTLYKDGNPSEIFRLEHVERSKKGIFDNDEIVGDLVFTNDYIYFIRSSEKIMLQELNCDGKKSLPNESLPLLTVIPRWYISSIEYMWNEICIKTKYYWINKPELHNYKLKKDIYKQFKSHIISYASGDLLGDVPGGMVGNVIDEVLKKTKEKFLTQDEEGYDNKGPHFSSDIQVKDISTKRCRNCGAIYPSADRHCPSCGK